ncbi:MAG: Gfo/Idh/MocA family protein [Spirochaetia bacterium]
MSLDVTIIGGGMITHDLILPSVYQLRREGKAAEVHVCALNNPPLTMLAESEEITGAFPEQSFIPHPGLDADPDENYPDLYKEVLDGMRPRQAVVVAMPDQLHYQVVKDALEREQHVLCVKPLVLKHAQAEEIRDLAYRKGLFVGVEYHKRFDRRSLLAKRQYALGHFGEFVMGEAKMIEPYLYRFSNFQNWFTTDKTDPFTYVGCHYVDLVYYITGLKPAEISVAGVKGKFPNGNEGYMWANGRVTFENGAILSVTDGLGYPDDGAGSNEQCLTMFCEGDGKSGMIKHNDQFRGVSHSYLEGLGPGGTRFNFVNPDFYRLVPWEGEGYKPVGYGFDSIAANISAMVRIENTAKNAGSSALEKRQELIRDIDERGLIATPANSSVNELVVEATRLSITRDGLPVKILYGDTPRVELR